MQLGKQFKVWVKSMQLEKEIKSKKKTCIAAALAEMNGIIF